jgi:signal transduction histidine kinase
MLNPDAMPRGILQRIRQLSLAAVEYFTPRSFVDREEDKRRAKMLVGFAILGDLFGFSFAAFYLWIGHYWGAGIILTCCTIFATVPFILKASGSADRAGNFYCLVLIAGFFSLCAVEGGMHGHALAWLASLPMCALLLTSRPAAYWWGGLAFLAAVTVVVADLVGHPMPFRYPKELHGTVSAAGYVTLVAFMFILGIIFEVGRVAALRRMQQTMEELAQANRDLKKLDQEKNEFLGIAAHDLKNPLSVVMAYSELMSTEMPDPARSARFATAINAESKRMRDLISNLLDLNAIESGRANLTIGEVEVCEAIRRSVENQRSMAEKKKIAIEFASSDEIFAKADASALLQVLDNLISNAVKFSKAGASVSVSVTSARDRVAISVVDRGPGISAADQQKLFRRFTKLTARPTGGESSNGLGLSIVKRLVDAMQGTIVCESELGKGATFRVSLPAVDGSAAQVKQSVAEPSFAGP